MEETNKLIEAEPENPYFHELKGQILFETGRIDESIEAYKKAYKLLPKASLIRMALAQALLETGKPEDREKAIDHLLYITARDKYMPEAWYFLHIAYGQNNQFALADYAKIEYSMLTGNYKEVKKLLPKTKEALKKDTVKSMRLADIEDTLNEKE